MSELANKLSELASRTFCPITCAGVGTRCMSEARQVYIVQSENPGGSCCICTKVNP